MSLDEHTLIQKYFSDVGSAFLAEKGVRVSVGDDAAIINNIPEKEFVVSIDTSIAEVHFLSSMDPSDIAYRSVAIALSDLAACGASPSWFTLALTVESIQEEWIKDFCKGLQSVCDEFRIPLVGGDTTKGPLSITVQVMGYCEEGCSITRKGAKAGDGIYVSGLIGSASKGLDDLKKGLEGTDDILTFTRPQARIELGKNLVGIATSAIDISDGLVQDLGHICSQSNLGCEVFLNKVPTKKNIPLTHKSINSGDDYEICFTANGLKEQIIKSVSEELGIPITKIGEMTEKKFIKVIDSEGKDIEVIAGYDHF